MKQKSIIKLQAVVRGHLVRSYAVGTLRCVQAIVRMQALVRARQRHLLEEGSGDSAKQFERSGTNNRDQTPLVFSFFLKSLFLSYVIFQIKAGCFPLNCLLGPNCF